MAHNEFLARKFLWRKLDVRLRRDRPMGPDPVAGPGSRAVLARIVMRDLSEEAMPFMAARR